MQFIKLSQTGLTVSGLTVSGLCLGTGTFGKQTDELESFRIFEKAADADVTPLDHTILSGGHPRAEAPLMLGNEGAGVIDDAGESGLAVGSRVMFTGPYGVGENGAWQEWLLVRPEHLALAPDAIDWRPLRERNQ